MPTISGENLTPADWTQAERQNVLDAIIAVGDVVPPSADLPGLTDAELVTLLTTVIDEINVRPATVKTEMQSLEFGGLTVIRQQ